MERRQSPVPYLTTAEYHHLITEAAFYMAELRGFNPGNLREDLRLAELRILNVISSTGAQYVGNTRLYR